MQCHAAVNRAWDVDVRAVLEQLVFVQGGSQVRSEDVPAVPTDAGGIQALVRVSNELYPEVGVRCLDVLGCGSAHSAGDIAGVQLRVDFLACPAVKCRCLLAAKARVSGVDGEVPCPPDGAACSVASASAGVRCFSFIAFSLVGGGSAGCVEFHLSKLFLMYGGLMNPIVNM